MTHLLTNPVINAITAVVVVQIISCYHGNFTARILGQWEVSVDIEKPGHSPVYQGNIHEEDKV